MFGFLKKIPENQEFVKIEFSESLDGEKIKVKQKCVLHVCLDFFFSLNFFFPSPFALFSGNSTYSYSSTFKSLGSVVVNCMACYLGATEREYATTTMNIIAFKVLSQMKVKIGNADMF